MFKKGDKVRFTGVNPNGGEKYGKGGDVATILVPDTGYSHDYKSNQAKVYLPGCDIEPGVPWSVLELIQGSPVRTVTRQEIVPGTYDGVGVNVGPEGELFIEVTPMATRDPDQLDRAAAVLTALAGALRDEQ